ncbi:MAG TPA: hypothetical protein VGE40_12110 [Bacilli bacterium]
MAKKEKAEPTIAPGMNTHDELEKKAAANEVKKGEFTPVTRLFLDRTPED